MKPFLVRSLTLGALVCAWLLQPAPALAEFQFKEGSFTKTDNTAVPVDQQITGVGFQPKAVIFFYTRQLVEGPVPDISGGWGFATGPSNERAIATGTVDNQAPASSARSGRAQSTTNCIVMVTGSLPVTVRAMAEIVQFEPDGFRIRWTTNEARQDIIHYIALGGSDITNAVADHFTITAGTGIQSVPVGFQPDFIMLLSIRSTLLDAGTTEAHHSVGFATSPTARAAIGVQMEDADGTRDTCVWQRTDSILLFAQTGANACPAVGGAGTERFDLSAFTATGFDVNKIANTLSGQYVHYLALKGGRYGVGSFAKNNVSPAPPGFNQAVAGVGFRPSGVILASDNLPSVATVQAEGRISFGAADLASNGATWWHDRDGLIPTDANMGTSTAYMATHGSGPGGGSLDAAAYLKSFDTNGFTLAWQYNNTGAGANHEILYAAFGEQTNFRSIGTAPNRSTATGDGTVTATFGSRVVTGAGTQWHTWNRGRGDVITISGTTYTVYRVLSNTLLELTTPFQGTAGSGLSYTIARQFMNLIAWEDCIDGPPGAGCTYFPVAGTSLVTDDRSEVGIAYKDSVLSGGLVINGNVVANTDAAHTITLTADFGNRHNGVAGTGVVINNGASSLPAVDVRDDFVTVEWLEIKGGGTAAADGIYVDVLTTGANANQIVLRQNLIHNAAGDGIEIADPDTIVDAYNNVIYRNARQGIRITSGVLSATSRLRILNNTIFSNTMEGVFKTLGVSPATIRLQNNIAHSNGTADFSADPLDSLDPVNSTDNLSGDTSASANSPGGGGIDSAGSADALFKTITPGLEDLHLELVGPPPAVNQAFDLSGIFTLDIDGLTRVLQWDIGADDVAATGSADLAITKTDGQTSEVPGTGVTYTMTVTNNGPDPVASLFVNDTVPGDILSPAFTPSVGNYNSGTGLWTGISLAMGQSATLTMTGTIRSSATADLANLVSVSPPAGFSDPVTGNDTAQDTDSLNPQTDLEASKSGPATARLGQTIAYSLSARNHGPSDATGVTLLDTLPPQVAFLSSVPPTCTYNTGLQQVSCPVGALAPGATSSPFTINVRVVSDGVLTNAASVNGGQFDPLSANNTALFMTSTGQSFCADNEGDPWWNRTWVRRRKITFSNAGQATNLVDFPVLVVLNSTRIDYAQTQNLGQDLRFVDENGTVLNHQIETWNEAGTSYVWVRVPQIDASSNSDFMYMYYGNPTASAPSLASQQATWDVDFKMVHHLNETGGGPTGHKDSTSNGNDSDVIFVTQQGSSTTPIINGHDRFVAASADYIHVGNSPTLNVGGGESLTVEAWVRLASTGGYQHVVAKETAGGEGLFQLAVDNGTVRFRVSDAAGDFAEPTSSTTLVANTWYYLVGRLNRSTGFATLFVNGAPQPNVSATLVGSLASSEPLGLGVETDGTPGWYLDGRMDEARVSKIDRSDDWIRAQYLSMTDTFSGYGPERGACNLRSIGTRPNYGTSQPEGATTTVTANAGSRTVTGASTLWKSANRGRGDVITIEAINYTVLSVDSETQLTLTSPYLGVSGPSKLYSIARQFATLSAWEDCIDGPPGAGCPYFPVASDSLVTDKRGEVGIAYRDSLLAGGLWIDSPNTLNTSADYTITLTADGSNRHHGFPGVGVVVDNAGGTSAAVRVSDNYVKVEWLEIRNGGAAVDGMTIDGLTLGAGANQVVVANNLVHNVPDGDGVDIADDDAIVDLYNNVVYNNSREGISISATALTAGSRVRLLNNTLYNNGLGGIWLHPAGTFTTVLLKNNLSVGNGTDGDYGINLPSGVPDPLSSYNLGEDGTEAGASPAGNSVNSTVAAVKFFNPAAGNLHIQSLSTAQNMGTPLTTIVDFDVDDSLRQTPWDIGADDGTASAWTDLAITKSDGQTTAVPGTAVTYTITVRNNGPTSVSSLSMIDVVPPDIPVPSWGGPTMGIYTPGTGVWDFAPDTLDPTESATITLSGTIRPSATGLLDNTATVLPPSGTSDPNPDNDSWLDRDNLTPEADLSVTKVVDTDPAVLGQTITYTVTARNIPGPSDAAAVTLVDSLPTGVEFVSSVPPGPACGYDAGAHEVTCDAGTLTPGGSPFSVQIQVRTLVGGVIRNQATVTSPPTADPDRANNIFALTSRVDVPSDAIRFFTVTSTHERNLLEWLNPTGFAKVRILYNSGPTSCAFPVDPVPPGFDGTVLASSEPGAAGEHDSLEHLVPGQNGWKFCYSVFVEKTLDVDYGPARSTAGRPFGTAGLVKWAYSVGATSMAPPGIGVDRVHAVANDNGLHAMEKAGVAGEEGTWPPGWKPNGDMNGPSQGRPTTITLPLAGPARVAFLGSQDRSVWAIDADSGATAWMSDDLGEMVLAAPSGMFIAFGGDRDHIFVGTRKSPQGEFYALRASDGVKVSDQWPFTEDAVYGKIGPVLSQAAVDYGTPKRVYFTSFAYDPDGPTDNNTVWCLDLTTPTPTACWAQAVSNVSTSPTVLGGRLYVGTSTGEVVALRTSDGGVDWSVATGDGPVKGFVAVERVSGDIYFSTTTKVHARRADSSSKWEIPLLSPSTPVILGGTSRIYVGSGDGNLYGLKELDGGNDFFPIPLGDGEAGVGSVTIDTRATPRHLYVGTEGGVIYAVQIP